MVDWIYAAIGGVLIGAGSALLLLYQGRIFGVSGILGGLLLTKQGETRWRIAVLAGLLTGGVMMRLAGAGVFDVAYPRSTALVVVAGLLVGFGTRLGNGCTSGHGVCGVSRLSARSIAATVTFVLTGMLTATLMGLASGGTP